MSDPALLWLLGSIKSNPEGMGLWCIDENADESILSLPTLPNISVISNRWDIATQLSQQGWNALFNDFELDQIPANSVDNFFYRISKEKAVTHHLSNQAWRCLKNGGTLYICGQKNEGIKTYLDKIATLFGCARQTEKQGNAYVACLQKQKEFSATDILDSSDYANLRPISEKILSKPGQFGWNKLDQGSAFLIAELPAILQRESIKPQQCLDLGCGYGYLSLMASQVQACNTVTQWILTDNNAAAILSASKNISTYGLPARVIADDCAASLQLKVDLLLCNPPFHQGFSVEGILTNRFLEAARRLVANQGIAVFVVNQFIPLEKKAASLFRRVDTVANNGSFKLVVLGP